MKCVINYKTNFVAAIVILGILMYVTTGFSLSFDEEKEHGRLSGCRRLCENVERAAADLHRERQETSDEENVSPIRLEELVKAGKIEGLKKCPSGGNIVIAYKIAKEEFNVSCTNHGTQQQMIERWMEFQERIDAEANGGVSLEPVKKQVGDSKHGFWIKAPDEATAEKRCLSNMKTLTGATELLIMETDKSEWSKTDMKSLVKTGYIKGEAKCPSDGDYGFLASGNSLKVLCSRHSDTKTLDTKIFKKNIEDDFAAGKKLCSKNADITTKGFHKLAKKKGISVIRKGDKFLTEFHKKWVKSGKAKCPKGFRLSFSIEDDKLIIICPKHGNFERKLP